MTHAGGDSALQAGNFHAELGDAHHHPASAVIDSQVGPFGHGGVGTDDVPAVVAELPTRLDGGSFAHDPVSLDHQHRTVVMGDHPLATANGDRHLGVVVDGDEVDEGMGLLGLLGLQPLIEQSVHRDLQARQLHQLGLASHPAKA